MRWVSKVSRGFTLHNKHVNPLMPQPDFSLLGKATPPPVSARCLVAISGCCGSRSSTAVCMEKQKDPTSPETLHIRKRAETLLLSLLVALALAIKSKS